MQVIDVAYDGRIDGYCTTILCDYSWLLEATTGAEANLSIQRGIIKGSKAYQTLRADLRKGCVLPPLVLARDSVEVPLALSQDAVRDAERRPALLEELGHLLAGPMPTATYIIDGLQRTNAIRQTRDEISTDGAALAQFLAIPLRVELWINISFGAIAYRMLLLNAGQKPMSIKHQVEVLSVKLEEDLRDIDGLDIRSSLASQRRTRAGQFTLAKLAQCFQAWLQGSPNIDVRNTVMEQLLAESAIETLGKSLSGAPAQDEFKALVSWMVDVDHAIWKDAQQFFGNETVLLGLSAAVGAAQRNESIRERMRSGLEKLRAAAIESGADALAVDRFDELRQGADVRKINVGQYTRDFVYRAFQEYFLADGLKSMRECWGFGALQS